MVISEPVLSTEAIQGNILRGFDSPYQTMLGLRLPEAQEVACAYIRLLLPRLTSLKAMHSMRLMRSAGLEAMLSSEWHTNVAFSLPGLQKLGLDTSGILDPLFLAPMGNFAGSMNDDLNSKGEPENYVLGQTWGDTPDAFLIIGASSAAGVEQALQDIQKEGVTAGCVVRFVERGAKLPGNTEHFGFRDGISQVGCRGRLSAAANDYLTPRYFAPEDPDGTNFAKPGQPLVWPGQFVFGYPGTEADDLSEPGEVVMGDHAWMLNGSYLVFRRLEQDIPAFRTFGAQAAVELSIGLGRPVTSDEAEALVVGRWPDGTPLLADARGENAMVSNDDMRVNNFDYRTDTPELSVLDGAVPRTIPPVKADRRAQVCPMFAHVRKVNARGMPTDQPRLTAALQIMRRGIPFGPLYSEDPCQKRGLLFLAYMTSVDRQFNLLTSQWMNNPLAPEVNTPGHDMLVGQALSGTPRQCTVKDGLGNVKATLSSNKKWVMPTGGGVFFAPGLDILGGL